jgi:quinol monooxygenase YgiN
VGHTRTSSADRWLTPAGSTAINSLLEEESFVPIFTTAEYRVKKSGVEKVKKAIKEFLPHIRANEPGTRVYAAWQCESDPTRFVHIFIFEDKAAHEAHANSAAVKKFEAAYSPELDGGPVLFTDFVNVASKPE